MGEKDIAMKSLAEYNDVFADIVNVFLFGGEQVIQPEDLEDEVSRSQYKADGKMHEVERDVVKIVKSRKIRIALVGLEHQTIPEKFMPARVLCYDGQGYRKQLLAKNVTRLYPVLTLVLYFGLEPWLYPKSISGVVDVPDRFKPFVSEYEMKNLFPVAFMDPEKVKLFRSDFKYVADYFVQRRISGTYKPMDKNAVAHIDELLKLFAVLQKDERFSQMIGKFPEEGGANMCDVLDKLIAEGQEEALKEAETKGFGQGYERGYGQGVEKVAMQLVAKGIRDQTILECTKLSQQRLDELRCQVASSKS